MLAPIQTILCLEGGCVVLYVDPLGDWLSVSDVSEDERLAVLGGIPFARDLVGDRIVLAD